jgi:hypothetical protein
VDRFDVLVVVADRQALGIRQRFLELGRQFILSHGVTPEFVLGRDTRLG